MKTKTIQTENKQYKKIKNTINKGYKNAISLEGIIFSLLFISFFLLLGQKIGGINLINTLINTTYDLLTKTVFRIMAIAVLAGAISELLMEFGVVSIINHIFSPLIGPIYGLPGASIVGILSSYLSDNPAILALASNKHFKMYYKKYQLPALTNIGTSFGMGAIVSVFIASINGPNGESMITPVIIGNIGAIIGSIVSTRLMLRETTKIYGKEATIQDDLDFDETYDILKYRKIREGSLGQRIISCLMDGGNMGVSMGISIIPGVLIICTFVMLLTNGPNSLGEYTGAAYEGVGLIPFIGEKLEFILKPLFGFSSSQAIAVPLTALGAAGAAIGLIPSMVSSGLATGNDVAVFTAICMCWSGYLSTHTAMMKSLGFQELTGKAIKSHTIGGFAAGISTNLIYKLFMTLI
ncbi:CD0519/CD1768 family membrane protein [Paratissierella segnis]|jgi:hypothetical protein|uniref:Transporter gate domain protein n=1 Tax=Paratissierella segnis TaxID=2763679 RepID=A0A926EVG1_9FIRM|nr:hypothetical protein [Paratissierella segnis]MBC8589028.1 hypothetical protein [Paratissierella segnis]